MAITHYCRASCEEGEQTSPVPVGEGHHDIQRGQEQHEVEEGVGVGDAVLLVVRGAGLPVAAAALLEAVSVGPVLHQSRLVAGQSQLVHLRGGRVPDARAKRTPGYKKEVPKEEQVPKEESAHLE